MCVLSRIAKVKESVENEKVLIVVLLAQLIINFCGTSYEPYPDSDV